MIRRVSRLGRTELTLFWRNRITVFTAVLLPLCTVPVFSSFDQGGPNAGNAVMMTGLIGTIVLFVVYYNLVTAYVARREELVLKRLRAGESRDGEILLATAVPAIVVTLGQSALAVAAGAVLLDLPAPVNAPVLLLGVAGGIVLFVLLAAVSTAFTRTVELAQVTTMPVLLVCLLGAGVFLPLDSYPDVVGRIGRFVPLTPVMDLVRLGWLGSTGTAEPLGFVATFGAAAIPFAILAGWIGLGWYGLRRWFRWEPRR